ncbi:MAG TPA: menaquinol oxidoreductase [Geobacteraceae bacterium]|nr:menaquinol oxidoreductase [Geobacteraceae bacterium]
MPDHIAGRINSCRETVRKLEKRAYAGIHILSAFILLSIGATRDFAFMPTFSPAIRKSMGAAPSPGFISIALAIYVFSAATLSLSRMMEGSDKTGGIAHLGYLGAFFFFYHMSSDMDSNFWAVFAAGVTILGLESYQRWHYCREEIQKEREMIASLEKHFERE